MSKNDHNHLKVDNNNNNNLIHSNIRIGEWVECPIGSGTFIKKNGLLWCKMHEHLCKPGRYNSVYYANNLAPLGKLI